ncbi:MAG: hypothetical protein H8E87_02230 [FCB group bacterium]|nr:hypothetical protein [FCB group bacterium]
MRKLFILALAAVIIIPSVSSAVEFMGGGKGLFYSVSALTSPVGMMSATFMSRNYGKLLEDNERISNNTLALGINFGFTRNIELAMTQLLYQDLNMRSEGSQYPDDTYIRMKIGNIKFLIKGKPVLFGLLTEIKFRTGAQDNIYMEPYVDAGISGRVDLLFSYYINPYFPEESPAFHTNVGYINYNDAISIGESAQAIPFALGFVKSDIKKEYSLELHGMFFAQRPTESKFSRENYIYTTPGFKYKIFMGLSVSAGLDVMLYTEDEKTALAAELPDGYPQYPEWRFNFKVDFIPSTGFYRINTFQKTEKGATSRESIRSRSIISSQKVLFDWVVDEEFGADYIDLELEKVRAERKKAEEELERLKQELEKKKSGK